MVFTGGCQCGAVRFRTEIDAGTASICHCRMCQKAFANFYAPLVTTVPGTLVWTKREPRRFRSSNHVQRGFCEACGTPLTYEPADHVSIAIGAFDDPEAIPPVGQDGCENKIGFVDRLSALPRRFTEDDIAETPFLGDLTSFQHPDAPDDDESPAV